MFVVCFNKETIRQKIPLLKWLHSKYIIILYCTQDSLLYFGLEYFFYH